MCGISGLVYFDPERRVDPETIARMNRVLHHRGPDDSGVWIGGNAGLGQARLSIIDLSPLGRQPMSNEDGSVWITLNGEIYNYAELRKELESKGHVFRSQTDTETVVHLWEEEGERCVERLRGMFALALWDGRSGTLFLARDRMGKKPLFYAELADRIVFGSEIKAVLQDRAIVPRPDLNAIYHYLAYQSVPAPLCAFEGLKKMPPAHTLTVRGGRSVLRRYWKLSYRDKIEVKGERGEAALKEEIIERLREAVRLRLRSDVPLGAFLSGGIDSSLIVALMAGLMDRPVKTFSIGFTNEEYDERVYARMIAEHYGTEHHEFVVTPDAQAILPELVWHYNEPFADSSAIPTYYVAEMARRHVTVVLSGDGGDENFAGYPRYQIAPVKSGLGASVKRLRDAAKRGEAWRAFECGGRRRTLNRARRLDAQKLQYYYRITHFHELYQERLLTPEFRKKIEPDCAVDWMLDKIDASDARDFIDVMMDLDLGLYLPDTLMTKTDIAAMAHSLEVRAPFLDHLFLEFAARIPSGLKLKGGTESKWILKRAAEPYLPNDIIGRKKMGFGVPIDHWFRNELKELVRDTLLSRRAAERGLFRREYVESLLDRHQEKGENWATLIWNLLMLEMWHLMFIDRTMAPPACHADEA
ncbi:MAG: asparagine synthase (glutamine-hydrolyzing) [Candidatus Aminicenantales bacterium]|jgi:asparagine synthase (glutamine-hydrolysing)